MIEIRKMAFTKASFEEVTRLLNHCFPSARHLTAAYLEWDYADNPAGKAIAYNAYDGERLVAHVGTQAMRARVRGALEKGLLTHNVATHPDYRVQKLFVELVRHAMEEGAGAGYGFALGIPNNNSLRGTTEHLGYQLLRPLDVKIGVGPSPAAGQGEPDFDRVWDATTLAWRLRCPSHRYAKQVRQGGTTVYAPSGLLGIGVELGTFPTELVPSGLPLLRTWNPVRVWIGFDGERDWGRAAYVDLPPRWRPAPLYFTIFDITGAGRVFRTDDIHLRGLDIDAY